MALTHTLRRLLVTLGSVSLLGITLAAAGSTSASASTIPNGNIQLCAQGSYSAYVHVLAEPIPNGGGATTPSLVSPVQIPGNCWMASVNTQGQWVQVDVVGVHRDGGEFYIGSEWWNSSTGIGIGAEGDDWSPWIQQW